MLSFFPTLPIITAVFLYVFPFKKAGKAIAILAQMALVAASFYLFFAVRQGDIIDPIGNYDGVLGVILRADTLAAVFVALVAFIFFVAALYRFHEDDGKLFWFFLFIWQGLLNGIFLTGDMFNRFVLIEVVTVVVSVMIMFNRDNRSQYDGLLHLMVNTVAVKFYLFGIGFVYRLTGTLDMHAARVALAQIDNSSLVLPFALVMTAVTLKCALAPLFSWFPKAAGTPGASTVVSTILSGLHIKSGIYMFIRFQALFGEIDASGFFLIIGIITGVVGFMWALSQSDIKLILAYNTISQMGLIIAGLNLSDNYAHVGSIYHVINHTLFKSALFLCAGLVAKAYGTRDTSEIRGVFKRMPIVGAAILMAILGITGTPFFNGSISRYFILSGAGVATTGAIMLINLGTILVFIKYSIMLFGQPKPGQGAVPIDNFKKASVLILGILCFAGGIFGEELIRFLFNVTASVDAAGYFEKTIFFILSGLAGFLIYKYYLKTSKLLAKVRQVEIGFRSMCTLMGIFFAVLLIATHLIV
ncbi:MAG: proton-conducting membrane transporter [Defluviitaleaceae bacterium]|nr:proton-conducting membrane transporter [Defluviitaleaceae bacterium]